MTIGCGNLVCMDRITQWHVQMQVYKYLYAMVDGREKQPPLSDTSPSHCSVLYYTVRVPEGEDARKPYMATCYRRLDQRPKWLLTE